MSTIAKRHKLNFAGYILIVLWGMSTWIHINAIFAQLPNIFPCVPEHGNIASVLSLAIQLGNIGPIVITLMQQKRMFGWISTDAGVRPPTVLSALIYVIIIIGTCGTFIISTKWNYNDGSRSLTLIITTFFLAISATSSSLLFFDYVKRYTATFSVNALLFGESINTVIPPILLLIQTKASVPSCQPQSSSYRFTDQNITSSTAITNISDCDKIHANLTFSTTTYFSIIGCIVLASFLAFTFLDCGILDPWKIKDKISVIKSPTKENFELEEIVDVNQPPSNNSSTDFDTTSDRQSRDKIHRDIFQLLGLSVIINFLNFGILPALSTYSTFPYGHSTFLIQSILTPFANVTSVLIGCFRSSTKSIKILSALVFLGFAGVCYIIAVAGLSPCSPLNQTKNGSAIIISVWFVATLILSYSRLLIVNRIRTIDPSKMFWFGFSVQVGGLLGAVPMYVVTTYTTLFTISSGCGDCL